MKAWRLGAGVVNSTYRLLGLPPIRWRAHKLRATQAGMKAKKIIHVMRKDAARTGKRVRIEPFLGERRFSVPTAEQGGRYVAPRRRSAAQPLYFCGYGVMNEAVLIDEPGS